MSRPTPTPRTSSTTSCTTASGTCPGAVPRTSTYALTNVTLPYAIAIASEGLVEAIRHDPDLALAVNVYDGQITNEGVAEAHGMEPVPLSELVDGLV